MAPNDHNIPQPLKDQADSGPVVVGDLVAAKWYDDDTYYVGEVDVDEDNEQYVKNIGGRGFVVDAHHIVKLMDADKWLRVLDEMVQAMFHPLGKAFPMVMTGDYSPEDTIVLDEQVKMAAIKWLHWNYPKI